MTTFLDLVDRLGGDARAHIDPRAAIQFFADTLGISEAMFTPLPAVPPTTDPEISSTTI
jgi:hypothetical protein